jgi:hypothetical protein
MALVLEQIDVIVTGAIDPAAISGLGFRTAPDIETALSELTQDTGGRGRSLLVAPYALQTLPVVQTRAGTHS